MRTFTGAGADVLGPLFSDASSYSAGLRRDQYSRVALNVGTGTTDDLDELIRELDEERADLEQKRERAAAAGRGDRRQAGAGRAAHRRVHRSPCRRPRPGSVS